MTEKAAAITDKELLKRVRWQVKTAEEFGNIGKFTGDYVLELASYQP